MFKSRPILAASIAFIAGLAFASFSFSAAAPAEDKAPTQEKISELLKERAEVLKARRNLVIEGHKNGVFDLDKVHHARLDYLHAILDLSANNAERVAVLKEIVEEAQSAHKFAVEALESNVGDTTDELRAKAYVLETRVALARAQQAK